MELKQVDRRRRAFLRAAGGAGALGTLAVLSAPAEAQPVTATPAPEAAHSKGYHETDHIRNYYRTARYW
jgi:hypothetical protein